MANQDIVDILIRSQFDGQGAQAAAKALTNVAAPAAQIVAALRAASQAAGQNETQFLELAGAASQLALKTGDAAKAEEILAQAMSKTTTAAEQAAPAIKKTGDEANGVGNYLKGMGDAGAAALNSLLGPAALVAGALVAIKGSFDLAKEGAQADLIGRRFDMMAASVGQSGAAITTALKSASGGEIDTASLKLDYMRAKLLGVGDSAAQLAPLMAIARDRAQEMGISTADAFEKIVTGLGRGSSRILDDIGIIVKAGAANDAYAASIGKTADQLSDAEKKQALINAVIAQGNATLAEGGGAIESSASDIQRVGAAWTNAKNAVGGFLAGGIVPLLNTFDELSDDLQKVTTATQSFGDAQVGVYGVTKQQAAAMREAATEAHAHATAVYVAADADDRREASTRTYTAAAYVAADADDRRIAAATTAAQVTQAEADASLTDAAAKQTQAAQTELLNFQTKTAAESFMVLNPNITGSGLASAVAAGQISQAVAQYIAMTLATQQAKNQLAQLQAQAGMSPAIKAAVAANPGDVGRYIGRTDGATAAEGAANVARLKVREQQDREQQAAAKSLELAKATAAQKVDIAQKDASDAARIYGAGSTQALNAQTKLVQAQEAASKKREAGAGAAANRLASIEQSAGNKLEDLDTKTQQKLLAIDEKYAAERAAAARKALDDIATTAADRRARDEADDLDLIGVKDAKQAQALNNRERAEAQARTQEQAAAAEAHARIEAGEGETAEKVYGIREKQIDAQQQLNEHFYARQAELAGDPKAEEALKAQYDEATRAIGAAADTQIGIADAAAQAKAAAVQAEKDAVIAAADAQGEHVVSRAMQTADGVKKASDSQTATTIGNLRKIADGINSLPTQHTVVVNIEQHGSAGGSGGDSGGGATARAGGGDTNVGRATLVGEEGPELVIFSAPGRVYSASQTRAMIPRMAQGGTIDAGDGYTTPIAGAGSGGHGHGGHGASGAGGAVSMEAATKALQGQIAYYKAVAELSNLLSAPLPTLDAAAMTTLANDARRVGSIVGGILVPISKDNSKMLDDYEKAVSGSVHILKDMQDIRKTLGEPSPPLNEAYVKALVDDIKIVGHYVGGSLRPIAMTAMLQLEDYEKAVNGAVNILKNMSDLRKEVAAAHSPLDPIAIYNLAIDAQRVTNTVSSLLIPFSEAQTAQIGNYADAVGGSVKALKDVTDLSGAMFGDYRSPTDAQINLLARDANRVTRAVAAAAKTYSADGLAAAKAFAESVGATFGAFKDGLLFFQALNSGDFVLDPANLTKFERATMQTLAVTKRLGAQAATIPASDIAALQTTTAALAAQAEALIRLAAVPFGDLPSAAAGLQAQAGQLLGGARGGGATTINIYNPPANMDVNAIARDVQTALNKNVQNRRY